MARQAIPQRKYPDAKPGMIGRPAAMDTTGMDPEMISTLGIPRMRQPGDTSGMKSKKKTAWETVIGLFTGKK